MNLAACPNRDRIRAWLDESSEDESSSDISQHITVCESCREIAEQLASTDASTFDWLRAVLVNHETSTPDACRRAIDSVRRIAEQSRIRLQGESLAPVRPLTTDRIADYLLMTEIGQGGMGRVFLATDNERRCRVALKIIGGDHLSRAASRARFERETELLLRMRDQHLVQALDAGTWRGLPWLVMEYLDGIDLANYVRRHGRLSPSEACEVVRQAALGASALHRAGLIHRDIKPSNLMLTRDGTIKLLDLGLARMVASDDWSDDLTATGHVLGSIRYMAPEQFTNPRGAGPAADLYSFGCTLWWLLTGQTPFADADVESPWQVMQAHQSAPTPDLRTAVSDVPRELAEIVQRLLVKDPAKRLGDAVDLANQLAPLCPANGVEQLASLASREPDMPLATTDQQQSAPRPFVLSVPIGETEVLEIETNAAPAGSIRGSAKWYLAGAVVCIVAAIPLARTFLVEKHRPPQPPNSAARQDEVASELPPIRIDAAAGSSLQSETRAKLLAELTKLIPVGDDFRWAKPQFSISSDGSSSAVPNQPLGSRVLVSRPAALPDVKSWTIETRTPRAHLWDAAFSTDGRCYATFDEVGVVRVHDAATDNLLRMFIPGGEITSLDWSPAGSWLAIGGSDTTVIILDIANGQRLRTVKLPGGGGGKEARWSPDGRLLAINISGGYVLYDPIAGSSRSVSVAPDENVRNLHWSRDGKRIAMACQSGRVLVANAEDGATVVDWTWDGSDPARQYVTDVAISPQGRWVAAARADGQIRVREIQSEQGEPIEQALTGHTASYVYRLAWLSESQILTSDGVSLRWFDPALDQPQRVLPNPLQYAGLKHGGIILSRFAVSPDAQQIVCPLRFERRVWRVDADGENDRQPGVDVPTIGFSGRLSGSSDGRWLAQTTVPHGVSIIDTQTLAEKHHLAIEPGGGVSTWSPDGSSLAVPTLGGLLIVDQFDAPSARRRLVYDGGVANIAWSPDGRRVGINNHGSAKLTWLDPKNWSRVGTATMPELGPFFGRDWSPDSRWLALGGNTRVTVLDVESGEAKFSIPQPRQVRGISWHPTEALVAVVAQDSVVRIMRLEDGSVEEFTRSSGIANDLLWSKDGQHLNILFAGVLQRRSWPDGSLTWSVPLAGHSVQSLVESPDGTRLTIACNGELHVFRAADGEPLGKRLSLGPDDWVFFAPTGETVGSPGYENWLLAVVETAKGQQSMPLAEFAKQFGGEGVGNRPSD